VVTDIAGREYRLVAGDLALDLLNTRGETPDGEVLTHPAALAAWARVAGVLDASHASALEGRTPAERQEAARLLREVLALRELLHQVLGAIAAGGQPPEAALTGLRDAESAALAHARLVRADGAFVWSWQRDPGGQRLPHKVAHAAVALLLAGPLDRLKRCGGCSYLFLDLSRNRSRRWCSMDDCGTAEKSRRFVTRRAVARRAGRTTSAAGGSGLSRSA
jgi:predicted RNA-binding Zn ribbon-like protein